MDSFWYTPHEYQKYFKFTKPNPFHRQISIMETLCVSTKLFKQCKEFFSLICPFKPWKKKNSKKKSIKNWEKKLNKNSFSIVAQSKLKYCSNDKTKWMGEFD